MAEIYDADLTKEEHLRKQHAKIEKNQDNIQNNFIKNADQDLTIKNNSDKIILLTGSVSSNQGKITDLQNKTEEIQGDVAANTAAIQSIPGQAEWERISANDLWMGYEDYINTHIIRITRDQNYSYYFNFSNYYYHRKESRKWRFDCFTSASQDSQNITYVYSAKISYDDFRVLIINRNGKKYRTYEIDDNDVYIQALRLSK